MQRTRGRGSLMDWSAGIPTACSLTKPRTSSRSSPSACDGRPILEGAGLSPGVASIARGLVLLAGVLALAEEEDEDETLTSTELILACFRRSWILTREPLVRAFLPLVGLLLLSGCVYLIAASIQINQRRCGGWLQRGWYRAGLNLIFKGRFQQQEFLRSQ